MANGQALVRLKAERKITSQVKALKGHETLLDEDDLTPAGQGENSCSAERAERFKAAALGVINDQAAEIVVRDQLIAEMKDLLKRQENLIEQFDRHADIALAHVQVAYDQIESERESRRRGQKNKNARLTKWRKKMVKMYWPQYRARGYSAHGFGVKVHRRFGLDGPRRVTQIIAELF